MLVVHVQGREHQPACADATALLFALDAKLAIPNGMHYVADCDPVRRKGEAGDPNALPTAAATFPATLRWWHLTVSVDGSDGGSDGGGGDGRGCGGGGD